MTLIGEKPITVPPGIPRREAAKLLFLPLDRAVLFLTGVLFLGIFVQVTLLHSRQNFRAASMWLPVVATPAVGLVLVALTFYPALWLHQAATWLLWAGVVIGLYGTFRHTVGVGQRVNGYTIDNFLVGPPVMLPLLIVVGALIGLAVISWRG